MPLNMRHGFNISAAKSGTSALIKFHRFIPLLQGKYNMLKLKRQDLVATIVLSP